MRNQAFGDRGAGLAMLKVLLPGVGGLGLWTASASAQQCDGWTAIGDPGARTRHAMTTDTTRGVVIMHGGHGDAEFTTSTTRLSSETWEYDGRTWKFRTLDGPLARSQHAIAYDPVRNRTYLFGGVAILPNGNIGSNNETWSWDGSAWTQLNPVNRPTARFGHAMAFDTVRGVVVLYGGVASPSGQEMWTFDGTDWTAIPAQPVWPGVRSQHGLAFDEGRGVLVLHGSTTPRTWEWNGTAWTAIGNTTGPAATITSMVFDPVRGKIVATSGNLGAVINQATQTWDGVAWVELGPPSRVGTAAGLLAWSPSSNSVVSFGFPPLSDPRAAEVSAGRLVGDVWVSDPGRAEPSRRVSTQLSSDRDRGVTTLFSGLVNTGGPALTDLWELRGDSWRQRVPATSATPPGRGDAAFVYDPARRRTVLAGAGSFGDSRLWEWDGNSWTSIRSFSNLASVGDYDTVNNRSLIFNTSGAAGLALWDGVTLGSGGSTPFSSANAGFAFDPVRGKAVSAGGNSMVGTFAWDPTTLTWTNLIRDTQTSTWDPGMTYDASRGGVVLFGGFTAAPNTQFSTSYQRETYVLPSDATAWQNTGLRGPFGRKFHGFAYDAVGRRVIMFGGLTNTTPLGDTWKLARGPAAVARPPVDTRTSPGSNTELYLIASGGGVIEYQWRRNGVPLVDTARIFGVNTDTLVFSPAATIDSGVYDCIVRNQCGTQTSSTAQLTVRCPADLDDGSGAGVPDGGVSVEDLLYFAAVYDAGQMAGDLDDGSGTGTPDGGVTIEDLLYFLARFEGGC